MNLFEAFKALDALNEDTFSVSDDGIAKLDEFQNDDELTDDIDVIDTEAETEDDLQDSYVGKVILDCGVCHSKIYKDKEEVELNEDQTLANVGEECPFCSTSDGFKIIGQVEDYSAENDEPETTDDEQPAEDDDDAVEESLSVSPIKDDIRDDKTESPTNTLAEAVATLERPMSAMGGTLSNVMTAHKDELSSIFDRESAISFLDAIEPEVKNKGYLNTVRTKLERVPNNRISQFLYNIILKGDGMGTKMESIKEAYTDVDGVMGEKGAKYTEDDLKAYWDKENKNDPVLANYKGNYQAWLKDTTSSMKVENLEEGIFNKKKKLTQQQPKTKREEKWEVFDQWHKWSVGEYDTKAEAEEAAASRGDDGRYRVQLVTKSLKESKSIKESSDSGYWYFTRHGVQPGSIPKGANVLTIQDVENGTYVKLDRVLTTKELNDYEIIEKRPEGLDESKSIKESAEVGRAEMIDALWYAPYRSKLYRDVDTTFEPTLCKYLNCTADELSFNNFDAFSDAMAKLSDSELMNCYNDYVSHVLSYLNMDNIPILTDDDITLLEGIGVSVGSYNFYDAEDAINTIDSVYFNNRDNKNYRIALNRIIRDCGANGYPVDGEFYEETYWDYERALKLIDVLNHISNKHVDESKSIKEDLKFNLFQDPYKGLESRISELDNSIQKARNEIDRLEKEKSKYQDSLSAEQHCQEVIKDFLNGIDIEVYYYNYIHQSKSLIVQTDYSEGTLKELKDTFSGSDVETDHNSYKKFVGEFKGHKVEVSYNESDGIIIKIRDFDDFTKSVNESKSIKESVNNVNVETDDSIVNVSSDENGKVTVTTEPVTATDTASEGGDVLAPVDAETQDTIMNGTSEEDNISIEDTAEEPVDGEEAPAEGGEVDAEVDEFVEESFNHLCGSYLREVYDNVESFQTSEVKENDKGLVVEGLIKFDSGNTKKTSFILEAKDCTRSGHCRFVGSNKHLSESTDPYLITGKISGGKLICESLSYDYSIESENYKGLVKRG